MSSEKFTPSTDFDASKPKDWPLYLGKLDWDTTSVVFTKRSLVEFLKSLDITVEPGFTNIQKLPRYARFGRITVEEDVADGAGAGTGLADDFGDDALSSVPPLAAPTSGAHAPACAANTDADADARPPPSGTQDFRPTRRVRTGPGGASSIAGLFGDDDPSTAQFVPTRKVRERPGGKDSIGGLFLEEP